MATTHKGIFCLEGFWYGDHRSRDTVRPILDLINSCEGVPYLYHKCATVEEFEYSVGCWKQPSFRKKYPILYLGFHGRKNAILIGQTEYTLDQLEKLLGDTCERTIIHFGSCSTLDIHKGRLNRFMKNTRALAIMGYQSDVNWMKSASFEILLLEHLNDCPLDSRGMKSFEKLLHAHCRLQAKELKFRLILNNQVHFSRPRKKLRKRNTPA